MQTHVKANPFGWYHKIYAIKKIVGGGGYHGNPVQKLDLCDLEKGQSVKMW